MQMPTTVTSSPEVEITPVSDRPPARELRNHSLDSTRWKGFPFREGDIVIASWAKAGTTWTQQILGQLIFNAAADLPIIDMCPWVDQRYRPLQSVMDQLQAQTHRRFMKTHLPSDAIQLCPFARYIYVGRDGRDALWSWHNHHRHLTPHALRLLNDTPGRVGPPLGPATDDLRQFFHDWLDRDGFPVWPFWSNVSSWWAVRERPNVLLVHFNNLKRDLEGEMRRIARFLGISVEESLWPRMLWHCSFEYMKQHGAQFSAMLKRGFVNGADDFFYRGNNGRWRETLTADDVHKYHRCAAAELSVECAHWLATGEGLERTVTASEVALDPNATRT